MNEHDESESDVDMLLLDSLEWAPSSQKSLVSAASEIVVEFIDQTFNYVYTELEKRPSEDVYVELERVTSSYRKSTNSGLKIKERKVKYYWPGKTAEEAWRFTCILAILLEVKKAIVSGVIVTKRDIYYRQPELFRSQAVVDKWIDDVAFTCRVSRRDLMVTGSQKGLVCGLSNTDRVQSIGQDFEQIRSRDIHHLRWILVVEKEASFNTLVEIGFDQSQVLGPGLIVTGKGYPDLQTRFFLRHILDTASSRNPINLFGLFDGDPDGHEICCCYHSGSKSLAHETGCRLPELQWLGIDICECLHRLNIMSHAVTLTSRDRAKARSMLARLTDQATGNPNGNIGRMLRTMLMLGVKMEIQGFEKVDGGIKTWLESNMANRSTRPGNRSWKSERCS